MRVDHSPLAGAYYDRLWTDAEYKARMDNIILNGDPADFAWQMLPFNADPEFKAYAMLLRPDAFANERRIADEYAAYYAQNPTVQASVVGPSAPQTGAEASAAIFAKHAEQKAQVNAIATDILQKAQAQLQSPSGAGSSLLPAWTPPLAADYSTAGGGGGEIFAFPAIGTETPSTTAEPKAGGGLLLAILGALALFS
jgi:hypothetical protein